MYKELKEDSCVGYVMEGIQAFLVGAEGVMKTGGIINKISTANVCVTAKALHVPVYVCTETIKFEFIEKSNLELEHPDVD